MLVQIINPQNEYHPSYFTGPKPWFHSYAHRDTHTKSKRHKLTGAYAQPEWVLRWIKTAKWLRHSIVAGLASLPFPFWARFEAVTVECSNHFPHTQQFLSNAKLTLRAQRCSLLPNLDTDAACNFRKIFTWRTQPLSHGVNGGQAAKLNMKSRQNGGRLRDCNIDEGVGSPRNQ